MIAFILSPLGKVLGAFAVAAALYAALMTNNAHQRAQGAKTERQAAVDRAGKLIEQMKKDQAKIRNMDAAALCLELGGSAYVDEECH